MKNITKLYYLSLLSIFAIILVLYATAPFGTGISGDSIAYLSGADTIAEGKGYLDIFGDPIVLYPPFFSFFAAAFMKLLNLSALSAGNLINALSFGMTVFFAGLILKKVFPSHTGVFVFGSLAMLISRPLFAITTVIAADTLFNVFVLLFLLLALNYLETKEMKYLLMLAIISSFSVFIRYLGVLFVFSGLILFILAHFSNLKVGIKKAFIYGLIASVGPFYLFIFRNYLTFNTFTGVWIGKRIVLDNLVFSFERMANWIIPYSLSKMIPLSYFFLVIILFVIFILIKKGWKESKTFFQDPFFVFVILCSLIYYIPVIFTAYTNDHNHYADDRYYLPLYFPFLLTILYFYKKFFYRQLGKFWKGFVYFAIVLFLLYNGRAIHSHTKKIRLGNGRIYNIYNLPDIREQDIFNSINNLPDNFSIFTNMPKLVYLYTDKTSKPAPIISNFSNESINIEELKSLWWSEGSVYYLWFDRSKNDIDYISPEQLGEFYEMELLIVSDNPVPILFYGDWTTEQKLNARLYVVNGSIE